MESQAPYPAAPPAPVVVPEPNSMPAAWCAARREEARKLVAEPNTPADVPALRTAVIELLSQTDRPPVVVPGGLGSANEQMTAEIAELSGRTIYDYEQAPEFALSDVRWLLSGLATATAEAAAAKERAAGLQAELAEQEVAKLELVKENTRIASGWAARRKAGKEEATKLLNFLLDKLHNDSVTAEDLCALAWEMGIDVVDPDA